ncbi:hypothetical protein GGQ91_004003 [Methylobacterium fujisawaense]|uniref:Uncharacterized protein n=1 Tax=Methylobacterium fujisawaense TaxID=107400 RepID=A0ABR6DET3_9HYPH|nr:hypothetical protein [Methylobacterium fujisawaense]MBA9064597.1 hypothetical protein [Methylobacterium fujisawaense]
MTIGHEQVLAEVMTLSATIQGAFQAAEGAASGTAAVTITDGSARVRAPAELRAGAGRPIRKDPGPRRRRSRTRAGRVAPLLQQHATPS